jgi:hypothetical protein
VSSTAVGVVATDGLGLAATVGSLVTVTTLPTVGGPGLLFGFRPRPAPRRARQPPSVVIGA